VPPPVPPAALGPTLRSVRDDLPVAWLQGVPNLVTKQTWRARYNYMIRALRQYGAANPFYDNEGNVRRNAIIPMNVDQFRALVNADWRRLAEPIADDQLTWTKDMVDPGRTTVDSIVSSPRVYKAFNLHKVGFRGDTRAPTNGLAPVFNLGFAARYALPNVETDNPAHHVLETILSQSMCINLTNQDFFNETGVCFARSVHGATKFPSPDQVGPNWLYAVRVERGFDTEQWQLGRGGHALWRPGEKATQRIAARQVLAAIQFRRRNYNAAAGAADVWYEYRLEGDIVWHNAGGATKAYIRGEMEPLVGRWIDFWRSEDFKL